MILDDILRHESNEDPQDIPLQVCDLDLITHVSNVSVHMMYIFMLQQIRLK